MPRDRWNRISSTKGKSVWQSLQDIVFTKLGFKTNDGKYYWPNSENKEENKVKATPKGQDDKQQNEFDLSTANTSLNTSMISEGNSENNIQKKQKEKKQSPHYMKSTKTQKNAEKVTEKQLQEIQSGIERVFIVNKKGDKSKHLQKQGQNVLRKNLNPKPPNQKGKTNKGLT